MSLVNGLLLFFFGCVVGWALFIIYDTIRDFFDKD